MKVTNAQKEFMKELIKELEELEVVEDIIFDMSLKSGNNHYKFKYSMSKSASES